MSKPMLSQIVEINRMHDDRLVIWKDGRASYTRNDDVIKKFGDVEIYDLVVHLSGGRGLRGEKAFIPKIEVIL